MKDYSLIVLFSILLTPAHSAANLIKYVELGINQSTLRNEECKSKIGPSFGVGLDYYPVKSFAGFVGTGLIYQNKRQLLESRTRPSSSDHRFASAVITQDIEVSISYVEIPLQIGYTTYFDDNINASLFGGYRYSIPIYNHTKSPEISERWLESGEAWYYEFDYILLDENYTTISKSYYLGMRVVIQRFGLSLIYARALSVSEGIDEHTSLHDYIDNISLSLQILF